MNHPAFSFGEVLLGSEPFYLISIPITAISVKIKIFLILHNPSSVYTPKWRNIRKSIIFEPFHSRVNYKDMECGSNFWVWRQNTIEWPFKSNPFNSTFTWDHLFFNILQNGFWGFWILIFGTLGSLWHDIMAFWEQVK